MGKRLTAIGVESGIGSMLVGARNAGFEIIGNIETRRQFKTGTFERNFKGAFMSDTCDPSKLPPIDLLMAHPKCGKFSSLGWANSGGKKDISTEHSSFETVIQWIKLIGPRFFIIDNLPRALEASPLSWWAKYLPGYRLNVEFVHNYGYGNVQLKRDRIFIMGWKDDVKDFQFIPGEVIHHRTVQNELLDLADEENPDINHTFFPSGMGAPNMSPLTVKEAAEFFKNEPEGRNPKYYRDEFDDIIYIPYEDLHFYDDEDIKTRIGTKKARWLKHGQTVTSGVNLYHPLRGDPMTCRERARLMGFPDDFIFVWKRPIDEFKQKPMGCQTGQAVPIQFMTYFSEMVAAWLNEDFFTSSKRRFKYSDVVQQSKINYCREYGHREYDCTFCSSNGICKIKETGIVK